MFSTSSRTLGVQRVDPSPLAPMGLTLTASYSHTGSSAGEPPLKKLRISNDFSDKFESTANQQVRECLHRVVGSEIRRLSAGDTDRRAAYDNLRAEVGKFHHNSHPTALGPKLGSANLAVSHR